MLRRFLLLFAITLGPVAVGAEPVALYNGKDLTGWHNVNTLPGTFFPKGDEIITTGKPTGFLRSDKQYENFVLEFDWMHIEKTKMANSGLFVWGDPLPAVGTQYTRGIEVQVLLNYKPADGWATSHGDIFSIWGARCKPDRPHPKGLERCLPSEDRVKGAGEWNHYKVVANDGSIKLEVNGKEVSGVSNCSPRKGYLALESEGVECHFKNLMLTELPSTNPKPEDVATVASGHKSLYTGATLDGWTSERGAWTGGGALRSAGTTPLTSVATFDAGELIFDYKLPKASTEAFTVNFAGRAITIENPATRPDGWARVTINVNQDMTTVKLGSKVTPAKVVAGVNGPVVFPAIKGLEFINVFAK